MDENKEIVNEDKFATEGQAKAAVIILVIIFIAAMVMIILMLDRRNARAIEQEKILQDELDEANERRGDLLAEAEELFLKKLKDNTENDITQLDAVLYSIDYTPTETGWVNDDGKLNFDFSDPACPKVYYYPEDSNSEYCRELTTTSAIDNYKCKLGAREFMLSQEDATAFGRVVVGDTSGFIKEE